MDDLIRQRDNLKKKLRELDDLAETGNEKILNAIKSQRWFFFENNKYILFDRDTAFIWASLNYFPYAKNESQDGYSHENNYSEVKTLMSNINSECWGGFSDWKIPTPFELWKMIEDKSFPFQEGDNWEIKSDFAWCVNHNSNLWGKDLYFGGAMEEIAGWDTAVLPCSRFYVPTDYENNISPSNNYYTETEKLQFTLNVFVDNNLKPIFNDEAITQLYRKIFVEKPALMKELAEVDAKIAELQTSQVKLMANFDYRTILAKFDAVAINKSVIKYSAVVLSVTDELIEILSEYEAAQSETIAEFLKIALKLNAKFTDNPNLTTEENKLLAERQKFLAERLELGTDAVKAQILSVKAQAENLSARIDKINRGDNSIRELAELQAEPRADFELLVENLAQIIKAAQHRVDFFTQNKDLVASIVNSQTAWTNSYKAFKTSLREELSAACREDSVDEEIFSAWYSDWQTKRFAIEQRFLPLVEFALKGNLLDSLDGVLKILGDYRDSVDKFYLHERKNIYQKFAFQSGGDLQEKFETESELYKLAEKFQYDLQEIIFSSDKTEERIFLLRWAEPLLNISIDEISNFIRDKELDAISDEVLTQFAELRRQNFTAYIADSKSYGEAVQRRENEFNKLIYRMRKDLRKN